MNLHSLFFLLNGDLAQAKKDFQEWEEVTEPDAELKLYEKFILKNQKAFNQSVNAQFATKTPNGTPLGTTEQIEVLKAFSDNVSITINKYRLVLALGQSPKIEEVEPTLEEKVAYLRLLVQRKIGLRRDNL